MEEDQIVTEVEDKGGKSVSHNPPKYDCSYDFHVAIFHLLRRAVGIKNMTTIYSLL